MESIDKKQLLNALRSKAWLILAAAMTATILSFFVTKLFITPMYTASTKMYVNNSSFTEGSGSAFSASEITAAQSLVDTYIVILNSRPTLTEVIAQAQVGYTPEQLADMITAEPVNDTEIFEVAVTCANAKHAERLANTISKVLPGKISETVHGSSVSLVDYAVEPTKPSSPNLIKNLLLAFVIGALMGTSAVILLEVMDDKLHSEEQLSRAYSEIPLLTVIPDVRDGKGSGGRYGKDYHRYYRKRTEEKR